MERLLRVVGVVLLASELCVAQVRPPVCPVHAGTKEASQSAGGGPAFGGSSAGYG